VAAQGKPKKRHLPEYPLDFNTLSEGNTEELAVGFTRFVF